MWHRGGAAEVVHRASCHRCGKRCYHIALCRAGALSSATRFELLSLRRHLSSRPFPCAFLFARRCGNLRKHNVRCNACPHTYCQRCAEKVIVEYGVTIFDEGCVQNARARCCWRCARVCASTRLPTAAPSAAAPSAARCAAATRRAAPSTARACTTATRSARRTKMRARRAAARR